MTDKAHPFQGPGLDEVMGRKQVTASPQAKQAHTLLAKAGRLGESISLPFRRRKQTAPAPVGHNQGPSLNGPTPERRAKDGDRFGDDDTGWLEVPQPGGQVLHKPKTVMEVYRDHFTDTEARTAQKLCDDAEWATRQRTICQRTYTGMVFANSTDPGALEDKRSFGMARLEYVLKRLTPAAQGAAAALIIGTRRAEDGKGMTVQEFQRLASNYTSKNTAGPLTVGYMKCLLQWVHCLQQDFLHWRERGIADAKAHRELAERIRSEERAIAAREVSSSFKADMEELTRLRALLPPELVSAAVPDVSRETSARSD